MLLRVTGNTSNQDHSRKITCFDGYSNVRGSEMYPQIIEEYSYRIVAMGHTYQYSGFDELIWGQRKR